MACISSALKGRLHINMCNCSGEFPLVNKTQHCERWEQPGCNAIGQYYTNSFLRFHWMGGVKCLCMDKLLCISEEWMTVQPPICFPLNMGKPNWTTWLWASALFPPDSHAFWNLILAVSQMWSGNGFFFPVRKPVETFQLSVPALFFS